MILAQRLCLAFGLLFACITAHGQSDNHSSVRGGATVDKKADPEAARQLMGDPDPGTVIIDFDDLNVGEYVSNQYSQYGLTLSADPRPGGYGTNPRIFDSSNPVTDSYGDWDLGSPNKYCSPKGPGRGDGGKPGKPTENCVPLGNILIIQEKNDNLDIPDDSANGGTITFAFHPAAPIVYQMGFLDPDYGGKITVTHGAGVETVFHMPDSGDNGFVTVDINLTNVSEIIVEFVRSGAVTFISFQPPVIVPEPEEPEKIEIPYDIVSLVDVDTCFDPVAWCEQELFDILVDELDGEEGLSPEEFDVLLNGLQAYFCDGVTAALASSMAVVRGSGVFALTRGGCCGGVNEISLDVNLDTATLALAAVDASASAEADARAYAFVKTGLCTRYASNTLRYRLCALARGSAYSAAVAEAQATGSASAVAGAGQSTDVSVYVDAHRINEFVALISTSASSFAGASATATAQAFATAYADAFAKVSASAYVKRYHCCRHKRRVCEKICHFGLCKCRWHWECMGTCDWWSTVFYEKFTLIAERVSFDVEQSFASAYASALAEVSIKVNIPAYFKDLPYPQDDIIMFNGDLDVAVDASTQCIATP